MSWLDSHLRDFPICPEIFYKWRPYEPGSFRPIPLKIIIHILVIWCNNTYAVKKHC